MRWFAEDSERDTPDWGPAPWDHVQGKGLQTQSGKIEFVSNSLKRLEATGVVDPERPVMGPQYIPSWEGHRTTELLSKYPLQLIMPHPRYSFHTHNDAKDSWGSTSSAKSAGSSPRSKSSIFPSLCMHCDNAPCMKVAPAGAVYKREDGLVIIDPEKAKGRREIVESCPYGAIYWNEEEQLAQKCTGCAHLIDEGWTQTRCSQGCP